MSKFVPTSILLTAPSNFATEVSNRSTIAVVVATFHNQAFYECLILLLIYCMFTFTCINITQNLCPFSDWNWVWKCLYAIKKVFGKWWNKLTRKGYAAVSSGGGVYDLEKCIDDGKWDNAFVNQMEATKPDNVQLCGLEKEKSLTGFFGGESATVDDYTITIAITMSKSQSSSFSSSSMYVVRLVIKWIVFLAWLCVFFICLTYLSIWGCIIVCECFDQQQKVVVVVVMYILFVVLHLGAFFYEIFIESY